jgi:hypothetical protein
VLRSKAAYELLTNYVKIREHRLNVDVLCGNLMFPCINLVEMPTRRASLHLAFIEFRIVCVSKTFVFETEPLPNPDTSRFRSFPSVRLSQNCISKTTFRKWTNDMSFDTLLIYGDH